MILYVNNDTTINVYSATLDGVADAGSGTVTLALTGSDGTTIFSGRAMTWVGGSAPRYHAIIESAELAPSDAVQVRPSAPGILTVTYVNGGANGSYSELIDFTTRRSGF